MSTFNQVRDLMGTNNIYQTPYDRAAENLGVPDDEARDAVRQWFREHGYAPVEEQPLVNEELARGLYIMVGDDLYKCENKQQLYWALMYPEELGGIRFDFDELPYTGYEMIQFIWDKNELWLIAVG